MSELQYDAYPYSVDPIVVEGLCRHLVEHNYLPEDAVDLVQKDLLHAFGPGTDGFYVAYLWQTSSDLRVMGLPREREDLAARDAVAMCCRYLCDTTEIAHIWFNDSGDNRVYRWVRELLATPPDEKDDSFWLIVLYRLNSWLVNIQVAVFHIPSERTGPVSHADGLEALRKLQAALESRPDIFRLEEPSHG
jgi:hypothetical protein